ncbi:MAG: FHA domain-containing protein [archaeon]|nr:FHA domain-containing protein [archaeon]
MNEESFKRVLYLIFKVLISSNGYLSQLEIFKEVRILLEKSFNLKESDLTFKLNQGKTEDFKDILNFILTILCELKLVTQKLERKSFYFKWNNIKPFYSSYSEYLLKESGFETSESMEHKAQIFTRNLLIFLYKNKDKGIRENEINILMNKCGLEGQYRNIDKIFIILTFIKFINKVGTGNIFKETVTQKFTLIRSDAPMTNYPNFQIINNIQPNIQPNINPQNIMESNGIFIPMPNTVSGLTPMNQVNFMNDPNLINNLSCLNDPNYLFSLSPPFVPVIFDQKGELITNPNDEILYKLNEEYINENTLDNKLDDSSLQNYSKSFKEMILNKGIELNEKVCSEEELENEIKMSTLYSKEKTYDFQGKDSSMSGTHFSYAKKFLKGVDKSEIKEEFSLKNGENIPKEIKKEEVKKNKLIQYKITVESFNKDYSDAGYAMLRSATWVYYMKKLHCIIGRKPLKYNKESNQRKTTWEVDLELNPSKKVSKQHALIVYNFTEKSFEIKNLSKKFPIRVNGELMNYNEEMPLRNKSLIVIGTHEFYFVLPQ